MELTDADVLYIRDASLDDLREELEYANPTDTEYRKALAAEILRRTAKAPEGEAQ
jgi:hypothetical protein